MITGHIRKMRTELSDTVSYKLPLDENLVDMNELIGKRVQLFRTGVITCSKCAKRTKSSFQGFCYSCFATAPEASECIIKPELCRGHLGEGRDVEWEKKHHVQPHYVYLALSSAVKVGVTRSDQIPTRWIDQGASAGIIVAETPNRYLAGVIEVALKEHFTDKTNWRKMLKNEVLTDVDLEDIKWELEEILPSDLAQYMLEEDEIIEINYPVTKYPEKLKSISFDKEPLLEGVLLGIKGQYLYFDNDRVINMRKHTSYQITIQWQG